MEEMEGGGWIRVGDVEYAVDAGATCRGGGDERRDRAFSPTGRAVSTAEAAAAADQEKARQLSARIGTWASASQPAWFTAAAPF